jgi:hypothetical protein
MPPAKSRKSSPPPRRGEFSGLRSGPIGWLFGPGRPLLALLVVGGVFGGAWNWSWLHVRNRVYASESYWLALENVEITAPPPWIHTDIRVRVFADANLDRPRLSITEDDLVQRIRAAFLLHPWVADVVRVQKSHPARVKVDLVYRRPVCMVEHAGELVPVDGQAVVLPGEDFSPVEASSYPRLVGIDAGPVGTIGTPWGDDRVLGGAEIAAALFESWEKLGLGQIACTSSSGTGLHEVPTYELVTRNRTRIPWGQAPSSDVSSDAPAKEKVARLEKYFAEHGTLDGRPGVVLLAPARPTAAEPPDSAGPLVPLQRSRRQP